MAVTTKRNLTSLADAPSATETEAAQRTHRNVRAYLESDPALNRYSVDTFLQGSYKNSTNVRSDSDVDAGCLSEKVFFYELDWLPNEPRSSQYEGVQDSLRESVQNQLNELGAGSFTFQEYRADVLASLNRKYGDSVEDGNKAIKIHGNTSRLDADVVPCTNFRQYYDSYGTASYHNGIAFFSNSGERIVNFPHQHFKNLTDKNQNTNGKVKGCVRILKRLRNEFEQKGEWDRNRSPSYYLEGLMWNVPNSKFVGGYDDIMKGVLRYLWDDLAGKKDDNDESGKYNQANNILRLFHYKFWNVKDAIAFIEKVWGEIYG